MVSCYRKLGWLLLLILLPTHAKAAPRYRFQATPSFRDEGNKPSGFVVNCASTTAIGGVWTVVTSSEPTRRSVIMQSAVANTANICIAPSTTTSPSYGTCKAGVPGNDLTPGSALTDYGTGQWICQTAPGASTQTIKGYYQIDTGDKGGLPSGF